MTASISLAEFDPRPTLVTESHEVHRARFAAIDAHNHLGRWLSPERTWMAPDVERLIDVMDACNIASVVNLDGMWGDELEANLNRYDRVFPDRFRTFAQCDWQLLSESGFGPRLARQLQDSVSRGARGLKVWKTLGLRFRDPHDKLLPIDDLRLDDLWSAAGHLGVPVLIHIADPVAFFQPLDAQNERWEELHGHPDWHFPSPDFPHFDTLIAQFEHIIARHPGTTFIGAHVGCYAENLGWVGRMLDTYANFNVDISARLAELGRQPYSTKRLLERYHERVLFGSDSFPPSTGGYAPYFRFLETADENFNYSSESIGSQGRWRIHGVALSDGPLQDIYANNARRLIR